MPKGRLLLSAWILCWSWAPAGAWAGELFWYDAENTGNGRIRHCNLAICSPSDFLTGVIAGLAGDMAVDPLERMLYWKVNNPAVANWTKVQRRSLLGGATEDIFFNDVAFQTTGMAVDPVARQFYWGTPGTAGRIKRYPIDDPSNPTSFVLFNEVGCSNCAPQGLVLDLANGFLYWADSANGKIARKALDMASPIEDVVTGLSQPRSLALDLANDRVYFSQVTPTRISYALLSSPATQADLLNPVSGTLGAGSLERDPSAGALGEMYVALGSAGEIRHCSIDAGCPSLALLDDGLNAPAGLALLPSSAPAVPTLGRRGVALACLAFLLAVLVLRQRTWRHGFESIRLRT